ncbi:MAG: DNA-binding protein [Candidatus Methanomethylicia archaeon]
MSKEAKIGRIIIARLRENEDLTQEIMRIIDERKVSSGQLMVIGALKRARFGIYVNGEYKVIEKTGHLEIVSCIGNIAEDENGKIIHAHITISGEDGICYGGHLMKDCIINPTAELTIIEGENLKITRKLDEKTKLKLLQP